MKSKLSAFESSSILAPYSRSVFAAVALAAAGASLSPAISRSAAIAVGNAFRSCSLAAVYAWVLSFIFSPPFLLRNFIGKTLLQGDNLFAFFPPQNLSPIFREKPCCHGLPRPAIGAGVAVIISSVGQAAGWPVHSPHWTGYGRQWPAFRLRTVSTCCHVCAVASHPRLNHPLPAVVLEPVHRCIPRKLRRSRAPVAILGDVHEKLLGCCRIP